MRTADVPQLREWLKKREKWVSPKIQNELLHLLAREVSMQIRDDVVGRSYSIICDGTTDVSGAEQEAICVRFVDQKREVREEFLCVIEPPDTCGKTLAAMLKGTLRGYSLEIADARGQTYDGASNMSGKYRGTQAYIKEEQPLALYVHCAAHCANLATEAMCAASTVVRNSLGTCKEVGVMFRSRHTMRRKFKELVADEGDDQSVKVLRPLCPTRWTVRGQSVTALLSQLSVAIQSLEELHDAKATCLAAGQLPAFGVNGVRPCRR